MFTKTSLELVILRILFHSCDACLSLKETNIVSTIYATIVLLLLSACAILVVTTRESTPCSLIRDPDAVKIPGSSTKSTRPTETKYRVHEDTSPRQIPSTSEMEEFFTGPEKQQQQLFIEKYNFDPVNDKPLPGRYEWVKLDDAKKS
ncbi:putative cyclin-dependent kinase inhibitor domain-containing protein [Helianthus annuus]|nr:putative cyclin-dependent kinase inhibitor domain-containing protein [Helianthus annuus]